ncbi:MAG: zinc ribbon domain-containing protein [Halorientalis sp.]
MYCHECGTEVEEYQSYCTECGARLHEPPGGSDSEPTVQPDAETAEIDAEPDAASVAGDDTPIDAGSATDAETGDTSHGDDGADPASDDSSSESPATGSSGELATSAFFGYAGIVLFRVSGVSELLFYPHGENPLFATPLHEVGVFVFYEGFGLALIAAVASGYLTARRFLAWDDLDGTLETVDWLASVALPLASLLYALGIGAAVLG